MDYWRNYYRMRCVQSEKVYNFGWLKSGGNGSLMSKMLSSMMKISEDVRYAGAGMYVSASSWQDAPTAPPQQSI